MSRRSSKPVSFTTTGDEIVDVQVNCLMKAVREKDLKTIERLCTGGVSNLVNCGSHPGGRTALMVAVFYGYMDVVNFLLDVLNADTELKDATGKTALIYASENGSTPAVIKLLNMGADIHWKDGDGRDALLHAVRNKSPFHTDTVVALLSRGASPVTTDNSGEVALIAACKRASHHEEIALALIQSGDDLNFVSADGENTTPLHQSCLSGSVKVVNMLLRNGADVEALDASQAAPLHMAAINGNVKVVLLLLAYSADPTRVDKDKSTALHYAAMYGNAAASKVLISRGCNPRSKNVDKKTAADLAKVCGFRNFRKQIKRISFNKHYSWNLRLYDHCCANEERLRWRFSRIDRANSGTIPRKNFFQVLSEENFHDINMMELKELADMHEKGNVEFDYELFLSGEKFVNKKHRMWPSDNGVIRPTTRKPTKSKRKKQNAGKLVFPLIVKTVEANEADEVVYVERVVNGGTRPRVENRPEHLYMDDSRWFRPDDQPKLIGLVEASAMGDVDTLRLAVDRGVNLNSTDKYYRTPLIAAVRSGDLNTVEMLLHYGADVNKPDSLKWTPLHHACVEGVLVIARLLVDRQANCNATSIAGTTPLMCAVSSSSHEIVKLLSTKNVDHELQTAAGQNAFDLVKVVGDSRMVKMFDDLFGSADNKKKATTMQAKRRPVNTYQPKPQSMEQAKLPPVRLPTRTLNGTNLADLQNRLKFEGLDDEEAAKVRAEATRGARARLVPHIQSIHADRMPIDYRIKDIRTAYGLPVDFRQFQPKIVQNADIVSKQVIAGRKKKKENK